ncbi:MAG: peptidylprolyl isomerase, partial [bacterium]|nr:peptidylprolyl isomerase [bacterium]
PKLTQLCFGALVSAFAALPALLPAQGRPPISPRPPAPNVRVANTGRTIRPQEFEPAKIVGRVGELTILAGDLLGPVNQTLAPYVGKAPEAELDRQKMLLMKQLLEDLIDIKILYYEFMRDVPDDKREVLNERIGKVFVETRLPQLIEESELTSAAELELKLRSYGSSLEKVKQQFTEGIISQEKLRGEIDMEPEVTHIEMLNYYRAHPEDYKIEARARFELLTVRLSKFNGDKQAAFQTIAQMGNEVIGGASFAAVAKRSSHGVRAQFGGYHDWTRKGSLASQKLDNSLFTLPLGKLSQIIEDEQGFHIMRVVERNGESKVPFTEAQSSIQNKIREGKVAEQRKAYLEKVRKSANVWTIFDDDTRSATVDDRAPNR